MGRASRRAPRKRPGGPLSRSTRRGLLVGGGVALAAAVGVGWEQRRPIHTWYENESGACGPGAPSVPDSNSLIVSGSFHSPTVPEPVGYAVSFPPGRHDHSKLPLVICMPGRGQTAESGMADLHLADFAALSPTPMALAVVDGGETYWHPRQTGEDRMTMLMHDFLPLLESKYGLGKAGRATFGWSMGGFGAILAAELYPRVFTAVAALSAAMWPTYAEQHSAVPDAFDSKLDFQINNSFAHIGRLNATPVFIAVGTGDPYHANDVEFASRLTRKPRTYFTAGCHDNNFWENAAGPAFRFLGAEFALQSY